MRILLAIPAHNEEGVIGQTLRILAAKLKELPEHSFEVVVAENGSTDRTAAVVRSFLPAHPSFRLLPVPVKGKGAAIRAAWSSADADAYAFMDADLATDLSALPRLIRHLDSAEVVIGSRALPDSTVRRSLLRRFVSSGYRLYGRLLLGTAVSDLACGFKAVSRRIVREIMPQVRDDAWFFDTELVVRAEKSGNRIAEIPVDWREEVPGGRRSKVDVFLVARQYAGACRRLRRELVRERRLVPWRRTEAAAVLGLGAALALVSSLPWLFGEYEAARRGLMVSGIGLFAPGDMAVYLSQISQAMDGHLFWRNPFTTEAVMPVPFVFWAAVGLLGRLVHLSAHGAFQAARILGAFAMMAAFWALFREVFQESRARRLWAVFLAGFGSGLGAYLFPFFRSAADEMSTDLWVSESLPFSSALHSGHFEFSWALLTLSLVGLLRFFRTGRIREAIIGGLAGAVLISFHPFYAVTLAVLGLVWSVVVAVRRGLDVKALVGVAVFGTLLIPSAAFQLAVPLSDANWAAINFANVTRTSRLWWVLSGFGVFVPLAIFGAVREWRHAKDRLVWACVAAWAVVGFGLAYLPLNFNRRLLEGLFLPLVILSVPALEAVWRRIKSLAGKAALRYAVLAGLLLLAPTSFLNLSSSAALYDEQDGLPVALDDADTSGLLDWCRTEVPKGAAVLASPDLSMRLAGWCGVRVYVGHDVATPRAPEKLARLGEFLYVDDDDARLSFLAEEGISFLVTEEGFDPWAGRGTPIWLEQVYANGRYKAYRISTLHAPHFPLPMFPFCPHGL